MHETARHPHITHHRQHHPISHAPPLCPVRYPSAAAADVNISQMCRFLCHVCAYTVACDSHTTLSLLLVAMTNSILFFWLTLYTTLGCRHINGSPPYLKASVVPGAYSKRHIIPEICNTRDLQRPIHQPLPFDGPAGLHMRGFDACRAHRSADSLCSDFVGFTPVIININATLWEGGLITGACDTRAKLASVYTR